MSSLPRVDSATRPAGSQEPRVSRPPVNRDTDVSRDTVRSADVDLSAWLALVNAACRKADVGPEKLAIAMEFSKGYISNVLVGEKALTLPFLHRLPEDVKDAMAQLQAESRGFIVVRPVSLDEGIEQFVRGLLSVLLHRDPSMRMAKAEIRK